MKYILSIQDFEKLNTIPYSIVIYSSIKSCHPCRLLKKWINEEYLSLTIFYINVDSSQFADDIYTLPTIDLLKYGTRVKRIEGFIKPEIKLILKYLETEEQDEKDEKDEEKKETRTTDEIINDISTHLNELQNI